MKQENKIFDFTIPPEQSNVGAMMETLSVYQEREVAEFILNLKRREQQREEQNFLEWIKVAILPIWKVFAEKSHSVLEIQETDEEIDILISNKEGFNICEKELGVKLAIGLSVYFSFYYIDDELRIDLVYSLPVV